MAPSLPFTMLRPAATVPHHPEITSFLNLQSAQEEKVYFSGPLVRNNVRNAEGNLHPSNGLWANIWAQIMGHTLCVWDMEAVEVANAKGTDVPPSYINVAECKLGVYGSVTSPQSVYTTTTTTQHNVISLHGAVGMDLILFACPSPSSLISWVAAFRLAAWEHGRFQELYTGHLFRAFLINLDIPKMDHIEGWCRLLLLNQTKWRRAWVVISARSPQQQHLTTRSKKRFSFLTALQDAAPVMHDGPRIQILSSNSEKHAKNPIVVVKNVTQATAVYPGRRDLIPHSSMLRVEGRFSSGSAVLEAEGREGAFLLLPQCSQGTTLFESLVQWLTAAHDVFSLYGRPQGWSWDPRNPKSLFFGYPVAASRDTSFLDRESLEGVDPRYSERSQVANSISQLIEKRFNAPPPVSTDAPDLGSASETEAVAIDPRSLLDGSDNSQAADARSGSEKAKVFCFCRPRTVSI